MHECFSCRVTRIALISKKNGSSLLPTNAKSEQQQQYMITHLRLKKNHEVLKVPEIGGVNCPG